MPCWRCRIRVSSTPRHTKNVKYGTYCCYLTRDTNMSRRECLSTQTDANHCNTQLGLSDRGSPFKWLVQGCLLGWLDEVLKYFTRQVNNLFIFQSEKEYSCGECGESFSTQIDLNNHMKLGHHNDTNDEEDNASEAGSSKYDIDTIRKGRLHG